MASYIPFLNSPDGLEIQKAYYADAVCVRVTLDQLPKLKPAIPKETHLWVDPAIEGFHHPVASRNPAWTTFIKKFEGHEKFDDPAFVANPDAKTITKFVNQLLDATLPYKPRRLTIPQLPHDKANTRKKLNRQLAEATGKWRASKTFAGTLMFPLVITHGTQLSSAAEKNNRLDHVKRCMSKVSFEGLWSADSSLADQHGSQSFEKERFPGVIDIFQSLRDLLGAAKPLCAGPYWGLNLVLWARGIVDEPAIGLGSSYQYHITGGIMHQGDARVALTPLRRYAVRSHDLHAWLQKTLAAVKQNPPAHNDFALLDKNWSLLADRKQARRQVAQAYKAWFDSVNAHPPQGRALALYQDLSTAYVLGKTLAELPRDEAPARRPERVAQQLMLNCL
jgi:hypothetical protein